MKNKNATDVIVYARESAHVGADESLEKQKERLLKFCAQRGFEVKGIVSAIGSRCDSQKALFEAIRSAQNTSGKMIVMASSNRVVGTLEELKEIVDLLDNSEVTITTMDGSLEAVQKYGVDTGALITNTLLSINEDDCESE